MKTFVSSGELLTLTAPYAVSSGGGMLVGNIFGVAITDLANAASGVVQTEGVFTLTAEGAASGQAISAGGLVYWDDTNKRCTATSSGNTRIGRATLAKTTTATSVTVLLDR